MSAANVVDSSFVFIGFIQRLSFFGYSSIIEVRQHNTATDKLNDKIYSKKARVEVLTKIMI